MSGWKYLPGFVIQFLNESYEMIFKSCQKRKQKENYFWGKQFYEFNNTQRQKYRRGFEWHSLRFINGSVINVWLLFGMTFMWLGNDWVAGNVTVQTFWLVVKKMLLKLALSKLKFFKVIYLK